MSTDHPTESLACVEEAIAILENVVPLSSSLATAYRNRASIARHNAQFAAAQDDFGSALRMGNEIDIGTDRTALILNELARLAVDREQMDLAKS